MLLLLLFYIFTFFAVTFCTPRVFERAKRNNRLTTVLSTYTRAAHTLHENCNCRIIFFVSHILVTTLWFIIIILLMLKLLLMLLMMHRGCISFLIVHVKMIEKSKMAKEKNRTKKNKPTI